MREHQLRASSTFFDNNRKYNTWLGIPNAKTKKRFAYQLDHVFIPKHQLCYTTNVKRKFDGAHSDHVAVCIEFSFLTSPMLKKKKDTQPPDKPTVKLDNAILRGTGLSNFQEKVNEFFERLLLESAIHLMPSELLDNLEEHIVKKANEIASTEKKNRPDWFSEAEEVLIELISKRNLAFKNFVKRPSEENGQKLKEARHQLLREKRRAKRHWQFVTPRNARKVILR
jgi:hypothetical protein